MKRTDESGKEIGPPGYLPGGPFCVFARRRGAQPSACSSPAGAASAAPELHKDGMTVKEIQAWLLESGYKAELKKDDGEGYVSSSAEGVSFEVYPNDCNAGRCASMPTGGAAFSTR